MGRIEICPLKRHNNVYNHYFYQANLEESDIRISETRKAMYEFERDICKGAINARTNKVIAEKVVRHFEDKIKSKVSNENVFRSTLLVLTSIPCW